MTRDDDLIRTLMLVLEQTSDYVKDSLAVEGYSRDQVAYHLALIVRAGYAEGPSPVTLLPEATPPFPWQW